VVAQGVYCEDSGHALLAVIVWMSHVVGVECFYLLYNGRQCCVLCIVCHATNTCLYFRLMLFMLYHLFGLVRVRTIWL
jgi:hypothetical protein